MKSLFVVMLLCGLGGYGSSGCAVTAVPEERPDMCDPPEFKIPPCEIVYTDGEPEVVCKVEGAPEEEWAMTANGTMYRYIVTPKSNHAPAKNICIVAPSGYVIWRAQ